MKLQFTHHGKIHEVTLGVPLLLKFELGTPPTNRLYDL
jgi:hypothetical protein